MSYQMPTGERLARLETRVDVLVQTQERMTGFLESMDGKVDKIHERLGARDATRTFVWKMAMMSSGVSAAVATAAVAFF